MKVCVVTPDLVGPVNNGGIGTYACHLVHLLATAGHDVDVLYTGPVSKDVGNDWRDGYAHERIRLTTIDHLPLTREASAFGVMRELTVSLQVHHWLQHRAFDLIHFQDWGANGFHAIEARRAGIAYLDTPICVTVHSPTEWSGEGGERWPSHPPRRQCRIQAERACLTGADLCICPSAYMRDWICERYSVDPQRTTVLANPIVQRAAVTTPAAAPDPAHWAFFGRLEHRKGLDLFMRAVELYCEGDAPPPRKLTFLGKDPSKGGSTTRMIREWAQRLPSVEVCVEAQLDAFAAVALLRDSGAVAIHPSRMDNCPYAIIECISAGLPFLASNVGGLPELCHPDCLFAPEAADLADAMGRIHRLGRGIIHPYRPAAANQRLLDWHAAPAGRKTTCCALSAHGAAAPQPSIAEVASIKAAESATADWLIWLPTPLQLSAAQRNLLLDAIAANRGDLIVSPWLERPLRWMPPSLPRQPLPLYLASAQPAYRENWRVFAIRATEFASFINEIRPRNRSQMVRQLPLWARQRKLSIAVLA